MYVDAILLGASAKSFLQSYEEAAADCERALSIAPHNTSVLIPGILMEPWPISNEFSNRPKTPRSDSADEACEDIDTARGLPSVDSFLID